MTDAPRSSLYALIREAARAALPESASVALVSTGVEVTWQQLSRLADEAVQRLGGLERQRVGVVAESSPGSIVALAALDRLASDAFLINPSLAADEREQLAQRFALTALLDARLADGRLQLCERRLAGGDAGSGEATVTILTSGTTGAPKAAQHTWGSLLRPARAGVAASPSWLLTYPLRLYAGLQVLCQCFTDRGTLVIAPPGASSDEIARLIVEREVEFASGTPSFWRKLLLFCDPELLVRSRLRQVTLGGEVVDQAVLDLLKRRLPRVRLVHVYASTEHGRCFSVTDEQAGFPRRFLDAVSPDGVQLKVEDGQLMIASRNAMRGYDKHSSSVELPTGDWWPTGDLVRLDGDRVFFEGRISDIINVGGHKVHPLEVERHVKEVPGVADASVFARRSSIAGQLVACEIVLAAGYTADAVRVAVARHCERLSSERRPRFIEFVPELAVSESGKTIRGRAR
jgi:acyl-CoA synthetase (AMP-forming)/AMP-acid ligase II